MVLQNEDYLFSLLLSQKIPIRNMAKKVRYCLLFVKGRVVSDMEMHNETAYSVTECGIIRITMSYLGVN